MTEEMELVLKLAREGADKAGCDGWRAQEKCRQIVNILSPKLSPKVQTMTEREMFERSFSRPKDFMRLTPDHQWAIDRSLGILDWEGTGLDEADMKRLNDHYI